MEPFRTPIEHIIAELQRLDLMLQRQIERMRAARLITNDDFRGLYIPDAHIDELLQAVSPAENDAIHRLSDSITALRVENEARATPDLPLARLAMEPFERDLLLIALAAEIDLRYEVLFSYVQNDVTKRRPTVDIALKLICDDLTSILDLRARLESSPAVRFRFVHFADDVQDRDPPLPARYLRMDERVAQYLLGSTAIDSRLAPSCTLEQDARQWPELLLPEGLRRSLETAKPHNAVFFMHGPQGAGKRAVAQRIAHRLGFALLTTATRSELPLTILRREAMLSNACIFLDRWEPPQCSGAELLMPDRPLFIGSKTEWHSPDAWPGARVFSFEFPPATVDIRRRAWEQALGCRNGTAAELAGKFLLSPGEIHRAARQAKEQAATPAAFPDALNAAARKQAQHDLALFAQRVETAYRWPDLVLPPRALEQVKELLRSVQHREEVYGAWGFEARMSLGKGVTALFAGPSGTGKTMAASLIARDLGLDLYRIDLAAMVSKYIGETEKNLARIFQQARAANGILFFDEADALFGKRSEVKDAHDRYANIEVAYLLQRMEEHEGIVILATNLGKNIDEAFARRMHHAIEFPFPDAPHRERIWRTVFPGPAPLGGDIDWGFLARQFELSGGNIRNSALRAAFFAAEERTPIGMPHVVRAVEREFQKMGKLPSKSEFRDYYDLIRQRM
jgi:ATPase family associated with various cellular activities (AAA)